MSPPDEQSLLQKLRSKFVQKSLSLSQRWYTPRQTEPFDMMSADWDVLILLDACHPGILHEELTGQFGSDATFETRHSHGTDSSEFIQNQFSGRQLHDTVYVTANPYFSLLPEGTFHATDNVLADEFNMDAGTVLPEVMVRRTLKALNDFPKKRVITHFMQPHFPFLGESGKQLRHGGISVGTSLETSAPNPWFGIMFGMLDPELVLSAYRENHQIAISAVTELLKDIPDKVIVSADHSNLVGQRLRPVPIRGYGHPSGLFHPGLTRVPWVTRPPEGPRRAVTPDPPKVERATDNNLEEKLTALGYK